MNKILEELGMKLDEALENETPESLAKWLEEKGLDPDWPREEVHLEGDEKQMITPIDK